MLRNPTNPRFNQGQFLAMPQSTGFTNLDSDMLDQFRTSKKLKSVGPEPQIPKDVQESPSFSDWPQLMTGQFLPVQPQVIAYCPKWQWMFLSYSMPIPFDLYVPNPSPCKSFFLVLISFLIPQTKVRNTIPYWRFDIGSVRYRCTEYFYIFLLL